MVAAVHALVQQVKIQTQGLPPEKAQPVVAKLTDDFWKKQQDVDLFSLSWAVFDTALSETRPTPELLRFLDGLLQVQDAGAALCGDAVPQPAGGAGPSSGGDWPIETVHRLLSVTVQGEQAASQFRAFEWLRGVLEQADQARYRAEYLFWARGYAPMAEADRLLRQAQDQYGQVLALQANVLTALKVRDEALAVLPAMVSYLDRLPPDEQVWLDAIDTTIELIDLLQPTNAPLAPEALRQRSDAWRQKSEVVSDYLTQLRRPFSADSQALLIKSAKQPETQTSVAREIDALLTTTELSAEDRVTMWKAGIQLSRELVDASLQADQAIQNQTTAAPLLPDVDQQHQEREQRQRADFRARAGHRLAAAGRPGGRRHPATGGRPGQLAA